MNGRACARRLMLCLGIALAVGSAAAQDMRMVELNGLQIRVRVDGWYPLSCRLARYN